MERILVCGVANSGNLGDRIIAESLNYIINKADKKYVITNFDFTVGEIVESKKKATVNLTSDKIFKKIIPNSIRYIKVSNYYRKNYILKEALTKQVSESHIIVIGGGHLLIDNYGNFPIGIYTIYKEARKNNIPIIFAFVGAKGPWSYKARKLLGEVLNYASYISVRDNDSKKFLISINPNIQQKIIALTDPALYVKEIYPPTQYKVGKKKIGLGIMDPNEMKRHSNISWSRTDSAIWWSKLAKELVKLNYEVNIFTNGATTDNGFVEQYIKKNLEEIEGISFSEYLSDYRNLIKTIENQDVIVAQRLHACLPSVSYYKHTYGIMWDPKLKSIFEELGLNNYLIDCKDEVEKVVQKIEKNLNEDFKLNEETINKIVCKKKELLNFVENSLSKKN
ncbi:polysaccharide pyruvyl transferase family protein [Planococcus donghaensis]|uniref:Polysaccharide pyruvyl transferase domain-containing protein n=1 Tax=Planococcus donghaensis TaxID=414778 RepID=A0A1C7EFP4_9BACL|nr:polysaccharide pyruvyl transferase family protein [Planococcus donghaensis]ANU22486.1 hypothetical protein BCM40_03560 [Planococcus donghaensis]